MGSNSSLSSKSSSISSSISIETLKCDRLIDAESQVYIGIVSKKNNNPLSHQAIRIGSNGKLKRLEKFVETSTNLIYEFESDTVLTLTKIVNNNNNNNDIIINLKEPDTMINLIKPMDLIVRKISKPINWTDCSNEFDKIPKFVFPIDIK